MTSKVQISELQFGGQSENEKKLRRLMDDLRKLQRAVNEMIDQVGSTIAVPVSEHVLATHAGLGPEHTVSGLLASEVLVANSATSALFRQLAFTDLAQTDISVTPDNLDVIQFYNGYYTNRPASSLLGVGDPDADAILGWNDSINGYQWILAGLGIDLVGGSLQIVPGEIDHAQLDNLDADSHPQYALRDAYAHSFLTMGA